MSSSALPPQNGVPDLSHSPQPTTAGKKTQQQPSRVRRRNRLITSCLECRRRKLKCDKGQPCANCTRNSRPCHFLAPSVDPEAQARLAEVKEKMGMLERSLEEDIARRSIQKAALPGQEESYSDQDDDEEAKDFRPTYLVTEDAAYYEDDNDDLVDLGIAMGKLRIAERIGGLVRPRLSDELAQALSELPEREQSTRTTSEPNLTSSLAPSRDYVAPFSSFLFAPGIERTSYQTHLLPRAVVDKLIAHYWVAVHAIARTVHRPSFERQYQKFWVNANLGIEGQTSFQAVLFAALLNSVVSMSEDTVRAEFGVEKQSWVDRFREGTEAALARANFLATTKLETLQAFVMYLIPLCRNEMSRAHSALTGSLIRLAECMGLHRDPTAYSSSPVEIQVRRLVWYQICFLDLRTCEAIGPRPQIRLDDYDTQFPLNIDDVDLDRAEHGDSSVDVSKDRSHFTDMTICRMRFECYEMHRFMLSERPKLDRRRADGKSEVTITSLLSRIQSFKAAMERTYVPMLSNSVPLHALASEMYGIMSDRLYISLLQKFLTSARSKMPDRLREITLSAATMILEHGMTIEQHPALTKWSWFVGALHQHHCALLLLNELYAGKREPAMEQRIWRCLDYSFDLPAELSNIEKTRLVLEDLVGKTKAWADLKRVRAPNDMPQARVRAHTQDGQSRHKESGEDSGCGGNLPSTTAGVASTSPTGSLTSQQMAASRQTQIQQQGPPLAHGINNFSGAIPSVDWGTVAMPSSNTGLQQPQVPPESFSFSNFTPTTLLPSRFRYVGSDASSPGSAMYAGMTPGTTDDSPMDAMNDVDWNDVEKMFGSAEVGAGNMLIPPFTFPQFAPTDLHWSTE